MIKCRNLGFAVFPPFLCEAAEKVFEHISKSPIKVNICTSHTVVSYKDTIIIKSNTNFFYQSEMSIIP